MGDEINRTSQIDEITELINAANHRFEIPVLIRSEIKINSKSKIRNQKILPI
jgi:hypothetical protein